MCFDQRLVQDDKLQDRKGETCCKVVCLRVTKWVKYEIFFDSFCFYFGIRKDAVSKKKKEEKSKRLCIHVGNLKLGCIFCCLTIRNKASKLSIISIKNFQFQHTDTHLKEILNKTSFLR